MPNLYGYGRASHRDSVASGLGPAAQIHNMRTWESLKRGLGLLGVPWAPRGFEGGICLDDNGEPIKDRSTGRLIKRDRDRDDGIFFDYGISAFTKPLVTRPAGQRLDAILTRGDHVVFAKFDRGFRRQLDWCIIHHRWTKRGITIHFVDPDVDCGTTNGRTMIGMLAVIAEDESSRKGDRQRDAAAQSRARGGDKGGPAMGFKRGPNGSYVPDDECRQTMLAIVAWRESRGPDRPPLSWWRVSDEIESIEALNEDRPTKPRVAFRECDRRTWSAERCKKAYRRAFEMGLCQGEAWAK